MVYINDNIANMDSITYGACLKCNNLLTQKPKKDLFGFPISICTNCSYRNVFSLSLFYKIVYYFLALVFVFYGINQLIHGRISFLILVSLLAVIALIRDWKLKKK